MVVDHVGSAELGQSWEQQGVEVVCRGGTQERDPLGSKETQMQAKQPSMCREKAVYKRLWFLTI